MPIKQGLNRDDTRAVAHMVKQGFTSEQCAAARGVDPKTMARYIEATFPELKGELKAPPKPPVDHRRSGEGADDPMEIPPLPGVSST